MQQHAISAYPRILLVAVMSLAAIAFVAVTYSAFADDSTPQATPTVWGDVTCDNRVGLSDVSDLLLRSAGLQQFHGCASQQPRLTVRLGSPTGAKPGDVVTVTIDADAAAFGTGLGSSRFDMAFDPLVLTPVSCTGYAGGCNATFSPGVARWAFVSFDSKGVIGTIHLGTIDFLVGGLLGSTTDVSMQNSVFTDQHGNHLTATAADLSLALSLTDTTPAPTPAPTAMPTNDEIWTYADLNCDGAINAGDVLAVLEYLAVDHGTSAPQGDCPAIGS
ncbi:MAG: hypothetical protein ABI559_03245 [Chloroflexota bacterium]